MIFKYPIRLRRGASFDLILSKYDICICIVVVNGFEDDERYQELSEGLLLRYHYGISLFVKIDTCKISQPHIVEYDTSDDNIFLKNFVRRVHYKVQNFSLFDIFSVDIVGVWFWEKCGFMGSILYYI